uniref:Uncharacterized protein n=1 Tax=Rhinopithecus roxellana TaxID=61622 RepID=A0A2K6QRU8_RHIRO
MEGEQGEDGKTAAGPGGSTSCSRRSRPWVSGRLRRQSGRARFPAAQSAAPEPPSTACAPEPLSESRLGAAFPRRLLRADAVPGLLFWFPAPSCGSLPGFGRPESPGHPRSSPSLRHHWGTLPRLASVFAPGSAAPSNPASRAWASPRRPRGQRPLVQPCGLAAFT